MLRCKVRLRGAAALFFVYMGKTALYRREKNECTIIRQNKKD